MSPDPTRFGSEEPAVDWDVDDHTPPEPYVLPEIVPATVDDDTSDPATPAEGLAPVPPLPPAEPVAPGRSVARDPNEHQSGVQGVGEHVGPVPTEAAAVALRRPGRRPRVRRVTRVLRHVDPWSAFKVGIIFSAVTYVVVLTSGVLLWRVADSTGTLDNVERWFTQFGWETFELDGEAIFRNARTIGLFGVVAMTGAIVLLVTLFNLVSDIVGGVRMTVLEEEVVERTASSSRRYVVRRTPPAAARATGAGDPAWNVDDGPDPLELVAERPPIPAGADWSIAASGGSTAAAEASDPQLDADESGDDLSDPAADLLAEPVDADWSIDGGPESPDGAVEDGVEEGVESATDPVVPAPTNGSEAIGAPANGAPGGRTNGDTSSSETGAAAPERPRDQVDAPAG